MKKKLNVAAIYFITFVIGGFIFAPAVSAATWYLPDLTASGKFNYMTVSRYGWIPQADGGRITPTLNAPASYAKLAYDRVPDRVSIYDGGYCNNSQIDTNVNMPCGSTDSRYQVYYDFQALNYETGELGPVKRFTSSQMPVQNLFTANLSDLQGVAPSADGKYFVQMYVHWQYENPPNCKPGMELPCIGGFNSFLLIMPRFTDLATYPATNAAAPPLSTYAKGPGAEEFSTITFEFAPKCFATGNALKRPLIWEDADFGQGNQPGDISWDLYDDTTGQRIDRRSNAQLGGQDIRVERNINFQMNHKYRWVWRNVYKGNGVNFILPFDGYNYYRECPPITPPPPPPPPVDPNLTRPFFKVNGGDLSAGQGMSAGSTSCSLRGANPLASILGWNRGAANGYAGAGTQQAAFARNHLQEFATAQTGSSGSLQPSGLSFANTAQAFTKGTPTSGGIYGGSFAGNGCVADQFIDDADTIRTSQKLSDLDPDRLPADGNIPNGQSFVYNIDGDLYIDQDVRFSGSYGSTGDIPSFKVVVKGNIYIERNVRQLDGSYVARPTNETSDNGDIYTCSNDDVVPYSAPVLNGALKSLCVNDLVVNGSFSARRVWLLRTGGDVATTPAETFNYVPEAWLSTKPSTTPQTGNYNSITGLPPVL